ncbi:MAG: hypothetical protein ABSC38_04220 [Verrucomicrobiia bacterium]
MKKLTLAFIGACLVATVVIAIIKWQTSLTPPATTTSQPAAAPAPSVKPSPRTFEASVSVAETPETDRSVPESPVEPAQALAVAAPPPAPVPVPPTAKPAVAMVLSQPLQTLVSPEASYAQKQAVWKQLKDTHQLDQAITDLEHAAQADPSAAEYPAALGQAYIQKLRTTEDIRDRTILAMQADQNFDQALNLDPSNWDARFWKAAALSRWPAELNKSEEVMQNLVTLVEQQEVQPPQPQFAQTYVLLGEQYQKAGYADYAREAWQRGAALFPDNNTLREKLAGLP